MSPHHTNEGIATEWFKSSYSNPAQECVEVRFDGHAVQVRDSKNGSTEPVMTFTARHWSHFLREVASHEA